MFNALIALVERGQANRLDPWLRLAREFPTGPGSPEAIILLSKPGVEDPRTAPIFLSRWEACAAAPTSATKASIASFSSSA